MRNPVRSSINAEQQGLRQSLRCGAQGLLRWAEDNSLGGLRWGCSMATMADGREVGRPRKEAMCPYVGHLAFGHHFWGRTQSRTARAPR